MTLGQRIKKLRKINGLSQQGLAEKIFVSPNNISAWENDKHKPDRGVRTLLEKVLNAEFSEGDFR